MHTSNTLTDVPLQRPRRHPWLPSLRVDAHRVLLAANDWAPLTEADSRAVNRAATAADGRATWQELAQDPHLTRGLTLLWRRGVLVDAAEPTPPAATPQARAAIERAMLTRAAAGDPRPSAAVARRSARPVLVFGGAEVGAELAAGLAAAGLHARVAGPRTEPDHETVAVTVGRPEWVQVQRWTSSRIPHLAVSPRADSVRVGPFVVPEESACLQCLHLARLDRRPHWRAVSAQLPGLAPPQPDPLLVLHAAAVAARLLVSFLQDGPHDVTGAYWEVALADVSPRRVPVDRHPLCGCWWPRAPQTDDAAVG